MLTQLKFDKGKTVEIYAVYPKRKLDTETLEYMQAWFYRKLKLTVESENTQLIITKYDKPKRFTFYVARRWRSFISGEPTNDWFTHELMLTKEACSRAEIKFEADKEQRIEDLSEFVAKLEREGKIYVVFGSEAFNEEHLLK